MFFSHTQNMNKDQTPSADSKKSLATACLGLALIFLASVVMSGCVVHHPGHGYTRGHGHKHGRGHHKAKIKVKPALGVSVSPLIVIDD